MAIHEYATVFDLAVEAKPYSIRVLNAKKAAAQIFSVASRELSATQKTKPIAGDNAGAAVGVVELQTQLSFPKRATLDIFVDDVWVLLQQHAAEHIGNGGHLVFATYRIPKGFSPWKGKTALVAYTLFMIQTSAQDLR